MSKTDGGPVFPGGKPLLAYPAGWKERYPEAAQEISTYSMRTPGMSLRDWFAGIAMQGLSVGCSGFLGESFSPYAKGPCNAELADRAYYLADAMLAERQKG